MQLAWLAAVLFAILVALFAVQNTTQVAVSFLFWSVSGVAIALVIIVSVALGAVITLLFGLPRFVRGQWRQRGLRKTLRQYEQRIAELEAEVERLRGRPVVVRELPPGGTGEAAPADTPSATPGDQPGPR